MQAQNFRASDLFDHRLHDRPRRFDQLGADLFEEVSPFFDRQRLDQVLFGRGQDALQANDDEVAQYMSANVLGAPSHVLLFKVSDPFADGGFDFSLSFHSDFGEIHFSEQRRLITNGGYWPRGRRRVRPPNGTAARH